MKERVMAIVSLIARYILADDEPLTEQEMMDRLLVAGFLPEEIQAAFGVMEQPDLSMLDETGLPPAATSFRVFSVDEERAISAEGRGFLLRLQQLGILDPAGLEEVIDRLLDDDGPGDLRDVKTLAALTLLSRSDACWNREIAHFLDGNLSGLYH